MGYTMTIRLPDELRAGLENASKKTHRKASQLVRDALRRYLAVERFRELREKTVPYAEKAGFFTDDDVLSLRRRKGK